MKDLLEQWAELEPERCYPHESPHSEYGYSVVYNENQGGVCASDLLIRHTVEQSIEARGWLWSLPNAIERDQNETWSRMSHIEWYRAVIIRAYGTFKYDAMHEGKSIDSSAHALLAAYLQAIKGDASHNS